MSCLALVSPIHQGSSITGRHQLDKRAIKTSGLFLYRSAPCSGSHKPLAVLWKCKVPTRPRSALEWMSQQAGSGLKAVNVIGRLGLSSLTLHLGSSNPRASSIPLILGPFSLPQSLIPPTLQYISSLFPFFLFIIILSSFHSIPSRQTGARLTTGWHTTSLYLSVCF